MAVPGWGGGLAWELSDLSWGEGSRHTDKAGLHVTLRANRKGQFGTEELLALGGFVSRK